jgi:hypothetical protein
MTPSGASKVAGIEVTTSGRHRGRSENGSHLQLAVKMSQSETLMTLTVEQIQIASLLSKRVQELAESGLDDLTLFGEMAEYMLGFKRLMDISSADEMDGLCESFPAFFRYAKILERIAEGIDSGEIKVPR